MSDDTTALQERIAGALHDHGNPLLSWDQLDPESRQDSIADAAAVLPILRAAQAVAWDAGHEAGVESEQGRDRLNPHRYQVEREG